MNIDLVAKEVEVTSDIQERLERKLEKILERTNKETPVRVLVSGETKGRFSTQISMHIFGKEVFAQAEEKNMIASLDEALEKVERQVLKVHDKIVDKR